MQFSLRTMLLLTAVVALLCYASFYCPTFFGTAPGPIEGLCRLFASLVLLWFFTWYVKGVIRDLTQKSSPKTMAEFRRRRPPL